MSKTTHPIRTLVCALCGTEFTAHRQNQKFCSPACRTTNNRAETAAKRQSARIRSRECPGCGSTFEPVGRQRFCSMRCGKRIQARKRLGLPNPSFVGKCWWCEAEFNLRHSRRVYCSKDCAWFVKSLWALSSRYGITRDDYRAAWYRQGGLCAVCRRPERTSRNRLLAIDHVHETGQFRGLLCSQCNRAMGMFSDDPIHLRSAADYIERHRAALTI